MSSVQHDPVASGNATETQDAELYIIVALHFEQIYSYILNLHLLCEVDEGNRE
jgi:hypothetical protein